jgi:hypothetical protein
MTLTLPRSPAVRSRPVATPEVLPAPVEVLGRTRTTVDGLAAGQARNARTEPLIDIVEEWGLQSFPASDPPTNW